MKTFRDLIDVERRRGRAAHLPPRPMAQIANRLGMTRAHLYNLMVGHRTPPSHTIARIALRLDLKVSTVEKAFAATAKAFAARVAS